MISIAFSSGRRCFRSMFSRAGAVVPALAFCVVLAPVEAHARLHEEPMPAPLTTPMATPMPAPLFAHTAAWPYSAFAAGAPLRFSGRMPERIAQASPGRFPVERRSREISDQEHAKDRRDRGQNKSFDELFQRARTVGRGEYLGVEPDISSNTYRFKFMRTSGKVVWVDMDGQTGRVVAERE